MDTGEACRCRGCEVGNLKPNDQLDADAFEDVFVPRGAEGSPKE